MNYILFNQQKLLPSKVVCIGRNYIEHIKELNNETPQEMVIFAKPNSAITTQLKYIDPTCRYESEIAFLIKDKSLQGIGFGFDLTKANLQQSLKSKGLPWERAKAFDNSAVFSSFIPLETNNLESLRLEVMINNTLKQKALFTDMIFKPQEIVEEVSSFMTLNDNDLIMTGTPKGVGTFKVGDTFSGKLYLNDQVILSEYFIVQ